MHYDKQVVIAIPHGLDEDKRLTIMKGAAVLHLKHRAQSTLLKWGDACAGRLAGLTSKSRLILVGHGTADGMRMGDYSAEHLAFTLKNAYGLRAVKRVVVMACEGGVANGVAQRLHLALGKPHNVFTEVTARTENLTVDVHGHKWTTSDKASFHRKVKGTKIGWRWKIVRTPRPQVARIGTITVQLPDVMVSTLVPEAFHDFDGYVDKAHAGNGVIPANVDIANSLGMLAAWDTVLSPNDMDAGIMARALAAARQAFLAEERRREDERAAEEQRRAAAAVPVVRATISAAAAAPRKKKEID